MQAETGYTEKVLILARAFKRMIGEMNSALKPLGITFEVWMVMQTLAAEDGRTMTKISREVELSLPTATKLIDRMVSDNLVYRRHSRQDRRIVNIYLTDAGRTILVNAQNIIARIWRDSSPDFE